MRFSGITRRGVLAAVAGVGLLVGVSTGPVGAVTTSCRAAGAAVLTLSDTTPSPHLSVAAGDRVVVLVPKWSWGHATVITDSKPTVLQQICSMLTNGGGRGAVFVAKRHGTSRLSATVAPASDLMMPGWEGSVTVTRR